MAIQKRFVVRSGVDNNSASIINVADPTNDQDAATKKFASNANNISSGTLPVLRGGTGQTTASGALNTFLPTQDGNSGKYLTTNGSDAAWSTLSLTNATLTGSNTVPALAITNAFENGNIKSSAPTSTQLLYVNEGAATYFTSNATTNWATDIRFSSTTSLNNSMSVGQLVTIVLITTQSATAYYHNSLLIDGSIVTPMWAGGTAPTAGHASSIDTYTFTIIKTANATFKVLAAQTQYK